MASRSMRTLTHGNIVQTVKVGQRLSISFVLDQLLCASVQKTDVLLKKVNYLQWATRDNHILDQLGESPLH